MRLIFLIPFHAITLLLKISSILLRSKINTDHKEKKQVLDTQYQSVSGKVSSVTTVVSGLIE